MLDRPWDDTFERLVRQATSLLSAATPLEANTDLRNHGLDSMATVELLLLVETEYDITIPDEHLTQATFATPTALWAVILDAREGTK